METVNTTAFSAWAKTLLLAKDFRRAQLLMHVQFANDNRGAEQFNPFIWMNLNLNLPELDVRYLFDGSSPGYEVNAVSYFDDPQQLVERIAHFGGNDEFWGSNYWWTPDDYVEFVRYFSPLAILAAEDEQYMWTIDDPEETVSYYNEIYDRLITESR